MKFKRGINPKESLQIGINSPEYIAYTRGAAPRRASS